MPHLSTTEWVSIGCSIFFLLLAILAGIRSWKKDRVIIKGEEAKAGAAVALQATNVLELSAVLANMLILLKTEMIKAMQEAVGVVARQLEDHAKQDADAQRTTNLALESIKRDTQKTEL